MLASITQSTCQIAVNKLVDAATAAELLEPDKQASLDVLNYVSSSEDRYAAAYADIAIRKVLKNKNPNRILYALALWEHLLEETDSKNAFQHVLLGRDAILTVEDLARGQRGRRVADSARDALTTACSRVPKSVNVEPHAAQLRLRVFDNKNGSELKKDYRKLMGDVSRVREWLDERVPRSVKTNAFLKQCVPRLNVIVDECLKGNVEGEVVGEVQFWIDLLEQVSEAVERATSGST